MTDPTNRADEREAIRRALAKKFDAFRSTQPGPEALITADFALAETHALREENERLLVMVDKLNGATREGGGDASLAVMMFLVLNKELTQLGDNPETRLHVDHLWKLVRGRAALVRENVALRLLMEELTGAAANNLDNGCKDRAESWDDVCELVTELDPEWAMRSEGTGIECMLAWIKRLAALAPPPQAAKEKETCGSSAPSSGTAAVDAASSGPASVCSSVASVVSNPSSASGRGTSKSAPVAGGASDAILELADLSRG